MSASWGDRMWEVTSVESFVLNVRTRRDSQLAFQLRRMVPLDVFTGQVDIAPAINRLNFFSIIPLTLLLTHLSSMLVRWLVDNSVCC